MAIMIRINQTHDQAGSPVSAEYLQAIYPTALKSAAGEVWKFVEPLQPAPTVDYQSGVYWYRDPVRGSGWLRVENVDMFTEDRLNQMVRLSQIERAIGEKDPVKGSEPGVASPFVLTMRNPYGQVGLGVLLLLMLIFFGSRIALIGGPPIFAITMAVMGLVLLAVSIYMFVTGVRRIPWWRRARAAALDDGGPMPDDLKMFW